jgi:Zn-dependent peptidase ImmA (M78 family)
MNEKVLGHTLKDELGTSITINKKLSGYRKNFTIAHKIGHLLLHVDDALPLDTKETISLAYSQFKKEVEANTFAAHLTLPDKVLKYQIMSGLSITAVSNISQISKETIYWRIVNFLMENLSLDQDTSVAFADEYRATHKNKDVLKTELFNQVINIGYEKPVLSPTHFGSFLLY